MSEPALQRRLTDPVPEWEARYVELKVHRPVPSLPVRLLRAIGTAIDEATHPRCLRTTADLLDCLSLLADVSASGRIAAVIGCGPQPDTIRDLAAAGFAAVGVEP
ncbi:MAG: hypothetical protein NTV49_00325, partial [Kiritimatiellaeota bacterium]|nr:hypothetical protein [Kiritimatiellota bacterium]